MSTRLFERASITRRKALISTGLLLLSARSLPLQAADDEEQAKCRARVDTVIDGIINSAVVPGISLALFDSHSVWHVRAAGVKNTATRAPVDAQTSFEAASLSKTVFASLVRRVIEQRRLALDTPVYRVLPPDDLSHDPRIRKLTPRNLLSHGSGLPNWRATPDSKARDYAHLFSPADKLRFIADPGTGFHYSGEGYLYLQRVVERVTGSTLDRLARQLVFQPLGLERCSYTFDATRESNYAVGYDRAGNDQGRRNRYVPLAPASLNTTAHDFATFLSQLMKRERSGTTTPMTQSFNEVETQKGVRVSWGLGLGILRLPDSDYFFHWGDNGSFRAYFLYSRAIDRGYVFFANSENGLSIVEKLSAAVFERHVPVWPRDYVQTGTP
jgi:CubicO group peptidase (beta-lactamase class C family)